MPRSLLDACAEFRQVLEVFDPALVSPGDCAAAVEALSATEKACGAARARAAARAVSAGAHHAAGFASGVDWLAAQAGSTNSDARLALETADALQSCPQTEDALLSGELSLSQAHEITRSQSELPGSEAELVDLAKRSSLTGLKNAVRDRVLNSTDPAELHRRQHASRQFRHWRDRDGTIRFAGGLTPSVGVPLMNRLEAEADRLRRQAHKAGSDEPFAAYAADALAAMMQGSGRPASTRAELVLVCDINAYRRGHAHPDEPCHIIDGGPIPVDLLRQLSADAFLTTAIHDGVNIHTLKRFGRYIPAELRTALELGAPPAFQGVECVETECARRYRLEWDHVNPVANQGPTNYDNLKPRCTPHHRQKTEQDRQAGLLGPRPP